MEDKFGVVYVLVALSNVPPEGALCQLTGEGEFAARVTDPFPQRATSKAVADPELMIACTGTRLLLQLSPGTKTYQS